jgi:hypothetical protein
LSKIIKLPDDHTKKAEPFKSSQLRQVFLSMSLVVFILVVVFTATQIERKNSKLIAGAPTSIDDVNRAIASTKPFDEVENLDWEQRIRKQLADLRNQRIPSAVGEPLDALAELKYKLGNYSVRYNSEGKIISFELVEGMDEPANHAIVALTDLCTVYQKALAVSFHACADIQQSFDGEISVQSAKLQNEGFSQVGVLVFRSLNGKAVSAMVEESKP